MDKQKKQIAILVVVVLLGAAVLAFMYRDKLTGAKPAAGSPLAEQGAGAGAAPAPGQPAPGQPAPGQPAPGQPGAPVAVAKDLPKPELKVPEVVAFTVDYKGMRDPLKVLDPDAAYSNQQQEVQALRTKWQLRGIAIIGREIIKTFKKNEDGTENPVPDLVEQDIWACFFDANPRFYREGDRLEETHFTVKSIHFDGESAFVEVEGDLGIRVKLHMITNDRYK
jgi:hypothetical protein